MSISAFKQFFLALVMVAVASLIYIMGLSSLFFTSGEALEQFYLLAIITCMPLGFIAFPHLLANRYQLYSKEAVVSFDWKMYFFLAGMILFVNRVWIKSDEYVQQLIISLCEEFLFRFVLYKMLRQSFSDWASILLTALLFAFVLHLNYPFMDNLLIRTPAGILLAWLATRYGLHYSIAGHWVYNLLISIGSF